MPAGRKNVGAHHVVGLLLLGVRRQLQAHEVGPRHAQVFGLAALPRPHVGKTEGGAGHARLVGFHAVVRQAALAILAVAAADVEGDAYPVAGLKVFDRRTDFHDHAEVFVAEDAALLKVGPALVHMKVGAADVSGGYLDNSVSRTFDLRIWYVFNCYVIRTAIDNSFHNLLL